MALGANKNTRYSCKSAPLRWLARSDNPLRHSEDRAYLFAMIMELAALASGQGEKAMAVMLTAIVTAYQEAQPEVRQHLSLATPGDSL